MPEVLTNEKRDIAPARRRRPWWGSAVVKVAIGAAALFVLAQLVPYRIDNPKVVAEPAWDASTRDLAVRACFDCHSNQTKKPWYANVAPVSWWTTNHVKEGRAGVNFSEWTNNPRTVNRVVRVLQEGSMPPSYFTWFGLHSDAKLTPAETQQFIDAMNALTATSTSTTKTGS